MNLIYEQTGDYLIPDLKLKQQGDPPMPLGKYGRMRRKYLKEHRPILYNSLALSEKLFPHLLEIEDAANQRMERMMREMAKAEGITEELKAADQMGWVGAMNNLKARMEEIILAELIYS